MGDITLDRAAFKALASDSRLAILKSLDEQEKTGTELARELDLNKATVSRHVEQLADVGLVKRIEAGGNRVEYALTWKGRRLLHPDELRIALLLSGSLAALVTAAAAAWAFLSRSRVPQPGPPETWPPPEVTPPPAGAEPWLPWVALALVALALVLALVAWRGRADAAKDA